MSDAAKAAAEKAAAEKPAGRKPPKEVTVAILGPVEHDGARYGEGDELVLDAKAAEALIAAGVARRA
jgi:hypothetical protein